MAELKTKRTEASVTAFLKRVADDTRRQDCLTVLRMMKRVTRAEPKMWGSNIVGFGNYHYEYASGRDGEWFLTGFAPRKRDLTLYIMAGVDRYNSLLAKLGRYKTGRSCLYIKRLADVDLTVLRKLISTSVRRMKQARGRVS
jgi:hypothetical protein